MSFTTPDGTYGITMKPNRMMRWFMSRQVRGIRRGKQRMMGFTALVLITKGRKTGTTYETPIAYFAQSSPSRHASASIPRRPTASCPSSG